MTEGERIYARERAEALRQGELTPPWCALDAATRLSYVQRGLSENLIDFEDENATTQENADAPIQCDTDSRDG